MKKSIFFTITILLALILKANGQSLTFNKLYHFGPEVDQEQARSIIETDNGYIVAGDVYSYSIPYEGYKLFLFETDKEGKLNWSVQYYSDSLNRFSSTCDLFRVNDSIFDWFIVQSDTSDYIRRPVLIRFNNKGDIKFTKVLYDPELLDSTSLTPIRAFKTMDNGYILECNAFPDASLLLKYNKNLELEWERNISFNNDFTNVTSIIQARDSSYFISYNRSNYNASITRVAKLDVRGNFLWTTAINGSKPRCIYELDLQEDSTFLSIGYEATSGPWWEHFQFGRYQVSKFNFEGEMLWSKLIGDTIYRPTITGRKKSKDGSLQFFGNSGIDNEGYIFRISNEADSIYYRPGLKYPGTNVYDSWVYNGILAADGNLILCGHVDLREPYNDWPDRAWLLKTDWYGCDIPGCDSTGVTIMNHTQSQIMCSGGNTSFGISALGNNLLFQWQIKKDSVWTNLEDDETYFGCTTETLQINNTVEINSNKVYRCKVWNEWYEQYVNEMLLIFKSGPEIMQQPLSQYIAEGGSAVLTIVASGIEQPEYLWYFNGNPIQAGNMPELFISPVMPSDTGLYQCRVWNYCGEKISVPSYLLFQPNGIDEIAGSTRNLVYPNPIQNEFWVPNTIGKSLAELYDQTGRLVFHSSSQDNHFILSRDIPSGVYFLKLKTEKEVTYIKVFKQ